MAEQKIDELKISEEEANAVRISNSADRPNAFNSYRESKKTAADVKKMFDAPFELLREKHDKTVDELRKYNAAETEREAAETEREEAETKRANAEQERKTAETARDDKIDEIYEAYKSGQLKGDKGDKGDPGSVNVVDGPGDSEKDAMSQKATTRELDKAAEEIKRVEELFTTIKTYVTPEMFGAKGDGVADDSVALQIAINHCISEDVPFVGSGKYLFSQGLVIASNRTKTAKIRFEGDLTYTGEDFAILLSGEFISLTLGGHLNCTAGGGIKMWDKGGTCYTAFNKIDFFTITTQGNGIEIYAETKGTYNNEIHGINLGRFDKGAVAPISDGSCGVKLYVPDTPSGAPFVSENTLDIRWIHNYHYGEYHGYIDNADTQYVFDNRVLYTSFETNLIGVALVNASAFVENPRMEELNNGKFAYYLDGDWCIEGEPRFDLSQVKFGEHIVPSARRITNLAKGYSQFTILNLGSPFFSKNGIYIPYGCRKAWAFNLDENTINECLFPNAIDYAVSTTDLADKDPSTIIEKVAIAQALYKSIYFSTNQTGSVVLSRTFYNYYNINSVEITVEGSSSADRYVYYGDGTLLLTIPKDAVWGYKATIKWESGGSDEAAFTPTVEASWLTAE